MAEVEIGLGAVVGHVHFPVLERGHRAGIHVDVGIELLNRDAEPALDQKPPQRGGRDALAEGAHHAAGHEDVLRRAHGLTSFSWRASCAATVFRSSAVSTPGAAGRSNSATPMGMPCASGRSCSRRSQVSSGTGGSRTPGRRAAPLEGYTPPCWGYTTP